MSRFKILVSLLFLFSVPAQAQLQNVVNWTRYAISGSLAVGKNQTSTVNPLSYAPDNVFLEVGPDLAKKAMMIPAVFHTDSIRSPMERMIVYSYTQGYMGYTPDGWVLLSGGSGGSGGANNYPTTFSFNTGTGNLTLGRNGLSSISASLDGRYAQSSSIASLVTSFLTSLPGYGEGKVLTASGGGFVWATGSVPEPTLTFHFGSHTSGTVPTESQIEALTAQEIPGDGSKIITFTNGTDEYLVFAYPATEPDPTQYYIGPLDNGSLGSGGTFAAPVTVGAYRVIISNYPTQIPTSVTFS